MKGIQGIEGGVGAHPTASLLARWPLLASLALLACSLAPALDIMGQPFSEKEREAAVRTSVLLKLALYVDYPEQAFSDSEAPFEICVVEPHALEPILEELTRDKQYEGRQVVVRRLEPSDIEAGCQVLYFGALSGDEAAELLDRIASRPMLTVGDGEEFLLQGGAIRLMRVGKNLRFAIDRDAIGGAGLEISSSVLKLAEEVYGGQGTGRRERRKP